MLRVRELASWLTSRVGSCGGGRLRRGRLPASVALSYAALGIAAAAAENHEVFPFFSWFLFPITPNEVVRFEINTSSRWHARALTLPMDLEVLVQKLGRSVLEDDAGEVRRFRRLLEQNFLVAPCSYELLESTYDPLRRWQARAITQRSIGAFACLSDP